MPVQGRTHMSALAGCVIITLQPVKATMDEMANIFTDKSPARWVAGILLAGLLLILFLWAGCSDKEILLGPVSPEVLTVESSGQLEGRWGSLSVYANGLPVTRYLIPAFGLSIGNNARLSSYNTDLSVSVTGERTGLFSTLASGVASDTANPLHTIQDVHNISGSYRLAAEGLLTVVLPAENPDEDTRYQSFSGTAFLAGDTLILSFTLASPPEKKTRSGFLPDTTSFIARLIRR